MGISSENLAMNFLGDFLEIREETAREIPNGNLEEFLKKNLELLEKISKEFFDNF